MKFKFVSIAVLAIAVSGITDASAQSSFILALANDDSKMKTSVSYSATAMTSIGNEATGSCDSSSYVQTCASGECECVELTGNITGSKIGKGIVEIDVTEDVGLALPNNVCVPIYADALIAGSKDVEVLFFNGDLCTGFSDNTFGQGGFSMQESSLFSAAIGSVTLTSEKNHISKWSFKGQAAR